MGRHSAVDDEDEYAGSAGVALAPAPERPTPRGRHARPEDDEATVPVRVADAVAEADTVRMPVPQAEAPDAPVAKLPGRGSQSTAADVALLRTRPDVRARCIAAVVVPFVLYVAAMLLIGANPAQYLIWIWIPLVSGGVLAGSILDAAHRRGPDRPVEDQSGPQG